MKKSDLEKCNALIEKYPDMKDDIIESINILLYDFNIEEAIELTKQALIFAKAGEL